MNIRFVIVAAFLAISIGTVAHFGNGLRAVAWTGALDLAVFAVWTYADWRRWRRGVDRRNTIRAAAR